MRREQFGGDAVAGSDVEHVAGFQQLQQRARQRFPGAAGRIVPLHVAGDGVGPAFVARTAGEHAGQAFGVLAQQCVVDARAQRGEQRSPVIVIVAVGAIVGRYAGAAIAHQSGLLELGQVRGHARLRQLQHAGQFGHGQLFAFEQREQAHPRRIGQQAQHVGGGRQIHAVSIYRDEKIFKARRARRCRQARSDGACRAAD
jgi:hypothetical protein